jgi:hypothetical protein
MPSKCIEEMNKKLGRSNNRSSATYSNNYSYNVYYNGSSSSTSSSTSLTHVVHLNNIPLSLATSNTISYFHY